MGAVTHRLDVKSVSSLPAGPVVSPAPRTKATRSKYHEHDRLVLVSSSFVGRRFPRRYLLIRLTIAISLLNYREKKLVDYFSSFKCSSSLLPSSQILYDTNVQKAKIITMFYFLLP